MRDEKGRWEKGVSGNPKARPLSDMRPHGFMNCSKIEKNRETARGQGL
jgi:hypothetical protein